MIEDCTPGPWAVAGPSCFAVLSDTDKGRFLVGVAHHGPNRRLLDTREIPQDVARANARLMALAPELLHALEVALPHLEQEVEQRESAGNAEYVDDIKAAAEEARTVLAKARGGQP